VFAWSPKEKADKAARIPLEDEQDNG